MYWRSRIRLQTAGRFIDVVLLATSTVLMLLMLTKFAAELDDRKTSRAIDLILSGAVEERCNVSEEFLNKVDMGYYIRRECLPEDIPLWEQPEPNPSFTEWNQKWCRA